MAKENQETFTFNVCEHPDGRIVKTFEIEAKDEEEAERLAEFAFKDFLNNLYFETE